MKGWRSKQINFSLCTKAPHSTLDLKMADQSESWSLYPYYPVKALPILFAIIVFSLGILHVYQSFFRYRWKKFGFMMLWATSIWVAGFICRTISVNKPQAVGIFIAQFVLIIVGPPIYAAAEYFILGRLIVSDYWDS